MAMFTIHKNLPPGYWFHKAESKPTQSKFNVSKKLSEEEEDDEDSLLVRLDPIDYKIYINPLILAQTEVY